MKLTWLELLGLAMLAAWFVGVACAYLKWGLG